MGATQGRDPNLNPLEQLQRQVNTLSDEVSANKDGIARLNANLLDKADRSELAEFVTRSDFADEGVELRSLIASLDRKISDDIDPLVQHHKIILEQIARSSDGTNYVPSIQANMAKDGFEEEMRQVVNSSIDGESFLMITNKTQVSQAITVNNGTTYTLVPEESRSIRVPTGNASTRLPGQDPVNWAVGPPTYGQELQIVSRRGAITYVCPLTY
jgi:hypothetical protein